MGTYHQVGDDAARGKSREQWLAIASSGTGKKQSFAQAWHHRSVVPSILTGRRLGTLAPAMSSVVNNTRPAWQLPVPRIVQRSSRRVRATEFPEHVLPIWLPLSGQLAIMSPCVSLQQILAQYVPAASHRRYGVKAIGIGGRGRGRRPYVQPCRLPPVQQSVVPFAIAEYDRERCESRVCIYFIQIRRRACTRYFAICSSICPNSKINQGKYISEF